LPVVWAKKSLGVNAVDEMGRPFVKITVTYVVESIVADEESIPL
jgi:hypothetical protein